MYKRYKISKTWRGMRHLYRRYKGDCTVIAPAATMLCTPEKRISHIRAINIEGGTSYEFLTNLWLYFLINVRFVEVYTVGTSKV